MNEDVISQDGVQSRRLGWAAYVHGKPLQGDQRYQYREKHM